MIDTDKYKDFISRKERRKRLSQCLQWAVLLLICAAAAVTLLTLKDYVPYQKSSEPLNNDKGFVALSYFGVSRNGDQILIGQERLAEHLAALQKQGYVTITQQDIADYYNDGKNLPDKSLFLMFEDGRRDTAIFAQKILEHLNYKATVFNYAEKFELNDTKFLMPAEITELENSTYWETGTNGYRLAFINVFDRYDNYIGQLDPLRYAEIAPYLGRRYNHYLMDYIRDADGMPKESYQLMRSRINYDYEKMRDVYLDSIGKVPGAYVLMHANTGAFGNNMQVSAVNEWWIKNLFLMNFNREGFSLNDRRSSIYDLTRMQPQAYWYTNHVLMRLKYDINEDVDFINGNQQKYDEWTVEKGAAEFKGQKIVLTSLPKEEGLIRLNGSDKFQNFKLSVKLTGNKFGQQRIYLRADRDLSQYVSVAVNNNILMIDEKVGAKSRNIFWLNLDKLDGKMPSSIPEDKKAAEAKTLETFLRYADSVEKAKLYKESLAVKEAEPAQSVAEGAAEYIPDIPVGAKGNRKLEINLYGNILSVKVDDKAAVTELPLALNESGNISLAAAWGGFGWSQRNLADDVYDGVFEDMAVTYPVPDGKEHVLFESRLTGWEGFCYRAEQYWQKIIDWFIKYL